ncbi:Phage tail assembly protein I [plant metagenome]|uniref:Phage tail assembly protein I n=1 Tax=plant metagenome TaxID=1297885 RepID=A0A484Q8E7_9ZZZZ
MSEELQTVRLYGKLGAAFGRVHRLVVSSAQEAVAALSATVPGFEQALLASEGLGVRYAVFHGRRNLGADDLGDAVVGEDIRIAPVLIGAKRGGLFQVMLGAALVVGASIAVPGGGAGLMAAFKAAPIYYGMVAGMGVSMALSGVAQMLTPQMQGLSSLDNPENGASYNFNGPVNTTAQGNCVPVLYGEMIIGSAVVSAGIYSEDQA